MSALKKMLMMANAQTPDQEIIPEEYIRCEYLASGGYSVIKTPYNGDNIIVEAILKSDNTTKTYCSPFGSRADYSGFAVFHYKDSGWGLNSSKKFPFNKEKIQLRAKLTIGDEYSIECLMNDTLDNVYNLTLKHVSTSDRNRYGFCIFSPRSSAAGDAFVGKIWSLKIYDFDENLLSNYIPCIRRGDERPGFYDLCTGLFLMDINNKLTAG